jgi:hypothetical protein
MRIESLVAQRPQLYMHAMSFCTMPPILGSRKIIEARGRALPYSTEVYDDRGL